MGETDTLGTSREIDSGLLEHARLGLKRIHTISHVGDMGRSGEITSKEDTKYLEVDKPKKKKKNVSLPTQPKEKKVEYIITKKPVEKSVFYQHSKQGMKYWFEEKKPKSYVSKIPMGRKGTLLGLVDAPFK